MERIVIYTDGACSGNPGPGGWAFVIPSIKAEESGYLADTTNNRMEITAVIRALDYVARETSYTHIDVVTDSQYVINTMTKGWKKNKNIDLWDELDDLMGLFDQVRWTWVKGHADNPYNQRCDELAVAEYKKYQNTIANTRPVKAKTVFEQIKEMNLEDLADWFFANVEWINSLLDCADAEDSIEIYDLLNSPNAFET